MILEGAQGGIRRAGNPLFVDVPAQMPALVGAAHVLPVLDQVHADAGAGDDGHGIREPGLLGERQAPAGHVIAEPEGRLGPQQGFQLRNELVGLRHIGFHVRKPAGQIAHAGHFTFGIVRRSGHVDEHAVQGSVFLKNPGTDLFDIVNQAFMKLGAGPARVQMIRAVGMTVTETFVVSNQGFPLLTAFGLWEKLRGDVLVTGHDAYPESPAANVDPHRDQSRLGCQLAPGRIEGQ